MPGFELFGDEERRAVNEVLHTGVLSRYGFDAARDGIWKAKDLETALAAYFGCRYAQLTNSGTAALTTALMALGIGAGHEVIIPAFGHVAGFEAVVAVGAVPVIADIDESLTLNPELLDKRISPNTKAVLAVHAAGGLADIGALKSICAERNLLLIEDASQAIGGSFPDGSMAGTAGHAGILSFDFTNTITCGEGGAVFTSDPVTYKRCDEFTDHGHDHLGAARHEDHHRYLGGSCRISELHAAVGLAQLKKLPQIMALQQRNHKTLADIVLTIDGVEQRPLHYGASFSWFSVLLPTEMKTQSAVAKLDAAGIPFAYWYDSRWHYVRKWEHLKNGSWMNRLYDDQKKQILHYSNQPFPVSDAVMSRCISFAISIAWTQEEAQKRGADIAAVLEQVHR